MPGNFIFRALKSILFWNDVRGLKIFSKAAVGQINKNLIIELFITFLAQGINEFF
jgi:hypothetical protein